ncbi:MAG TPA: hypothetical protein ENG03_07045 [Thioploca sp.]|nr:MAG: hypothetical protein DRR19_03015 [Gammaproteobacteria bacterium]HDN26840.1 hypothetical protein [Thioploca sp.]
MFKLKISNLKEALQLSQNWATHTISLLDPDIENDILREIPVAGKGGKLQRYYFYDLYPKDKDLSLLIFLRGESVMATSEQLQELLALTAPLKSTDKLLVHCHAGVSRSTAVACAVLCQHGLTPSQAVKYVVSIRPQAHPNKYVLTLFDDILGLKGELVVAGTEEIVIFKKKHFTSLFRR